MEQNLIVEISHDGDFGIHLLQTKKHGVRENLGVPGTFRFGYGRLSRTPDLKIQLLKPRKKKKGRIQSIIITGCLMGDWYGFV